MNQPVTPPKPKSDDLDEFLNENQDEWQVTYLDTVTILLTFFIILASMGTTNQGMMMVEAPKEANKDEGKDKDMVPAQANLFFPIEALYFDLNQTLKQEIEQGVVTLDKGKYEIRMNFSGSAFYASGEADLLPQGKEIIVRMVRELTGLERDDFKLDVEGHTDGTPISTLRFKDNWELSAARAANVVRFFLQEGVDAEKLKASGYADTYPLFPERNEAGQMIPENQKKNRRIVVRLYYN
jgi:chemotaxis protein MotB